MTTRADLVIRPKLYVRGELHLGLLGVGNSHLRFRSSSLKIG